MTTGIRTSLLLAVAASLLLGACSDPLADDEDRGQAAENPLAADVPDPARDTMLAELDELRALLADARDHLVDAGDADAAGARTAATTAVELLAGDPADGREPLFPAERGERGSGGGRDDRLTGVLTVTREAGGDDARAISELLRDLVAGDLGSWQRDAGGMLDLVEDAARPAGSVEEAEETVLGLPGEATRALAWAMLARDARELERAHAYAERGATHLDIAVGAIDDLDLDVPEEEG